MFKQLVLYKVLFKIFQVMINGSGRTWFFVSLAGILLLMSIIILPGCGKAVYQEGVGNDSIDPDLRVMSYNIQHGRGMDGEVNLERIAQVIIDEGADIVALQEVDVGVERSYRLDIAAELAELTGLEYMAFGKNIDHQGGNFGNATISRYPIIEWQNTHFEKVGTEQRGVLETLIDMNGWSVLLLNTHLAHRSEDNEERVLYARKTRDEILHRYDVDAVIYAGDFNDVSGSPVHEVMTSYMTDVWKVVGEGHGFTIPPNNPSRRIDYFFYTGRISPVASWVPVSMASDHLPVVADFIKDDK